jgi:SAM-dependent methyltransferase
MPEAEAGSRRMPRTRAVDRIEYLTFLARGRRVIHVGFAGETRASMSELLSRSTWLHGQLAGSASTLIGIDLDAAGVERARALGLEAFAADASDPAALAPLALAPVELVIVGEVIEHVEHPGRLLDAMHDLVTTGGLLAITTPNAASLLNPLAAMARVELTNPDHVAFYSWYTLTNLLQRHGWSVREVVTYHFPFADEAWTGGGKATLARAMVRLQTLLSRIWPYLDFGLVAVAEASSEGDA